MIFISVDGRSDEFGGWLTFLGSAVFGGTLNLNVDDFDRSLGTPLSPLGALLARSRSRSRSRPCSLCRGV